MNEGIVKLGNGGEFLKGTVKEQLDKLRASFPNTPEEMEYGAFNGYWFYLMHVPLALSGFTKTVIKIGLRCCYYK